MTVLILLNILLIVFSVLLGLSGSGGLNWFNKWQSLETQGVRDPTTRGPPAESHNSGPSLEQNGMDLNDSKERNHVIYL